MSTYVLTQIILNLIFLAAGALLIAKGMDIAEESGPTSKSRTYKTIGIILIVLVVLGFIGNFLPKE